MKEGSQKNITSIISQDEAGICQAVEILRAGGIVALPTETVYGLAGNALMPNVIDKIYKAKARPLNNPLIWHVHSLEKALTLFDIASLSEQSYKRLICLAQNFWPGPLTLVCKKSPVLPLAYDTVAIRIPKTAPTLEIIRRCDFPLAMPSANLSSRPSPTTAQHVLKTLSGRIDAVFMGDHAEGGLESTVVLIDDRVTILRPGLISIKEIQNALKETVNNEVTSHKKILSPGTRYLHYAPKMKSVSLNLVNDASKFFYLRPLIIGRNIELDQLRNMAGSSLADFIDLSNEPKIFARQLYDAFYRAEEYKDRHLILILPPNHEEWAAINDRMKRAAGLS